MSEILPLHVVCFLFDPSIGGPTIRARAVYERLMRDGHDAFVAFPRNSGPALDYIRAAGVPAARLNIAKPVPPSRPLAFLKFVAGLPLYVWRVRRWLRRVRPHLVHVNGAFDVVPAFAARAAGVPLVWHLNDTVFGPVPSRILGKLVRSLATQIVVAADRVGDHYGIPADRRTTLYAPVDISRFAERPPKSASVSPLRVALIANWNPIKGQERFVAVVSRLIGAGYEVTGTIFGRFLESQRSYWTRIQADIAKRGFQEVIRTPGFCEDTRTALVDNDIMLLTSRSEACPISVLEAMAVGVPQVVFDVGGVRELLGEGDEAAGIVVPEGDVAAMAEAVARLAERPAEYQRMAANGARRARRLFSLDACVERHLSVYRSATECL